MIVSSGEVMEFEDLTPEQATVAQDMIREATLDDIYTSFNEIGDTLQRMTTVIGGNESPDLDIQFDPQTKKTTWRIRDDVKRQLAADADLGTAEKEYMVYQRKANDAEGNPQYGFDYVRGVPSTEE